MVRRLVVSVDPEDSNYSEIKEFIKHFPEIEFFDYSDDNSYEIAFYRIVYSPTFIIMDGSTRIFSWAELPEAEEIWRYLSEDA